ncbi:17275_t:CDS:2 [Funneliformis geosporum]|nr:17275_t:CDS:2 [Funneliformis geosporum]
MPDHLSAFLKVEDILHNCPWFITIATRIVSDEIKDVVDGKSRKCNI